MLFHVGLILLLAAGLVEPRGVFYTGGRLRGVYVPAKVYSLLPVREHSDNSGSMEAEMDTEVADVNNNNNGGSSAQGMSQSEMMHQQSMSQNQAVQQHMTSRGGSSGRMTLDRNSGVSQSEQMELMETVELMQRQMRAPKTPEEANSNLAVLEDIMRRMASMVERMREMRDSQRGGCSVSGFVCLLSVLSLVYTVHTPQC